MEDPMVSKEKPDAVGDRQALLDPLPGSPRGAELPSRSALREESHGAQDGSAEDWSGWRLPILPRAAVPDPGACGQPSP
jgi:hypothetical protein